MHKLLNVPVSIWIAQIIYVVVMLTILFVIVSIFGSNNKFNVRVFATWYIIAMIIVNIIWCVIVSRLIN